MTRALLVALAMLACASCAATKPTLRLRDIPVMNKFTMEAADSTPRTLAWTMPTLYADGDTLADGYRRWECAYVSQSQAWRDSSAAMLADSATWARRWPVVAAQMEPVVVASGYARPGEAVEVPMPLVISLYWPCWFVVRAWTDVPGGWSNAVLGWKE